LLFKSNFFKILKGKKHYELRYDLIKKREENKENQENNNNPPSNKISPKDEEENQKSLTFNPTKMDNTINDRYKFMGFPQNSNFENVEDLVFEINKNCALVEFSPSLVIKKEEMVKNKKHKKQKYNTKK
jgi:hypothetical protein